MDSGFINLVIWESRDKLQKMNHDLMLLQALQHFSNLSILTINCSEKLSESFTSLYTQLLKYDLRLLSLLDQVFGNAALWSEQQFLYYESFP